MKRHAIVPLALVSLMGGAFAHPKDFTARVETYAAQPRKGHIVITPLYSGRSAYGAYVVVPTYPLVGPRWRSLEGY